MALSGKRLGLAALAVAAYACILVGVWAARPLHDSVPVGTDWTPTLAVPPLPQQLVSQRVTCNTLFSGDARPDEPLPELTPQPKGLPPLAFEREPCTLVHTDARRNLAINLIAIVGMFGVIGALARRTRRHADVAT